MMFRVRALRVVIAVLVVSLFFVGTASAQTRVWFKVTAPSTYVRNGPGWDATRIASLFEDQVVAVTGKNADETWLRVSVPGVQSEAWINATVGEVIGDLSTILVVEAAPATATPAPATPAPASAQPTSVATVSSLSITISARSTYARSAPGFSATKVASLFQGQSYTANGRDADGSWLRINLPGAGNLWIAEFVAEVDGNPNSLPEVSAEVTTTAAQPASTTVSAPVTYSVSAPVVSTSAGAFELGGQAQGFGSNAVSAMQRAGMTWVKRQVVWGPNDNASSHVGLINEAHIRGFKVLLSVTGGSLGDATPDNFPAYAAFAADLAAAGADAIEIWNEQNINREGNDHSIILPSVYANLLQHAYTAIKAANPATLVVSGAPAPTGFFGGCTGIGCDDSLYIAGMVAAGGLNYVDCIGIHYNEGVVRPSQSSGDPRGNPNHYTRYYQTMVDTYYGLANGQRPLCFTELGYLSGEEWGYLPAGFLWKPPYNLSVAEHAQYLAEAAQLSMAQGKVRLMIVFNVDIDHFSDDPQAGYAMIRPGGGCPACDAFGAVMGAG